MERYPVAALKVSSDVVEVLLERGEAGVTEVADALDLPKSTVHGHLKTLSELGYVVNESGRYRLSTKFLRVGKAVRDDHELFVNGREVATALFERLDGQYVQLVTEENGRCAVLLATGPARSSQTYPTDVHLHSNAPGKAILAEWDDEAVRSLLDERGLPARTPATTTDRDALLAELEAVRELGYAVDEGELIAGMSGVAVGVVTDGTVHGAVAVYGPTETFPDGLADSELLAAVRRSAEEIEANLIFTAD